MSLAARRAGRAGVNAWPGWVDALSSLIMVVIFVLMIFAVAQSLMQNALLNRDDALVGLNQRIAALSEVLAAERAANAEMSARAEALAAQLSELTARREALEADLAGSRGQTRQLQDRLAAQTRLSQAAEARIDVLTVEITTLRAELSRLNSALEASEERAAEQNVQIASLSERLNKALASKVEELNRYRSEFFGRLREVLGSRAEVRIVGDRFVFQSEVLFASGEASLSEAGQEQLARLADTLGLVTAEIPEDIDWVLRVDGHTDSVPINNWRFPSNWELSAGRAIEVVKFLVSEGIPADRLAAAGFGEHQPIAEGEDPEALARNRRIEIRFDQRGGGEQD